MHEQYFSKFRQGIIGIDQEIPTPFGSKKLLYADWVASGRLYQKIEHTISQEIGPYCANTHSETSLTGTLMTKSYHESKQFIKREVNADEHDVLIYSGSGMTDSINKLQRILGLRIPEKSQNFLQSFNIKKPEERPIVFVTHIEHHSNHTSWLETLADVEIIGPDNEGCVDLNHFAQLLEKYSSRPYKIASVSACSNVTGIFTPYHKIAEMIHQEGGLCFVDFACSAPYVKIDMRPENKLQHLDVIFISPHKFLGGPGTPGIMVLHKDLYSNTIPDNSGGGTVKFTSPFQNHEYIDDIEEREDGGTPPFLQGIKSALCFKLKKEMDVEHILQRENVIVQKILGGLSEIPNIKVLASHLTHRVGAISFYVEGLHFNLGVRLLNDYFGIQVRGGCACAGTYGHYLLNVDREKSAEIIEHIRAGELFLKPGWIRLSIHPTHTDLEVQTILEALDYISKNHLALAEKYQYNAHNNSFFRKDYDARFEDQFVSQLFYQ